MKKTFVIAGLLLSYFLVSGAEPGLVDTANSRFAKMRTTGLDEVHWTRGFWAERFESCRTEMIPGMERLMEGTNYSQFFRNFEIAAGLTDGKSRGASFNDGDFYKWMEAATALLAVTNDPVLSKRLDEIIAVIGKAQRPDGYIHTPTLIKAQHGDSNAVPFQDRNNFEMYNMGHLFTTASLYYRVTGKTNLLTIARKAADFLYDTFHGASPEAARSSVCPSHYMGIVELYRVTREPRYLELAKKFFELRNEITDGGADNQDRVPLGEQTEAEGHAVRANYLYAGAADLYMETGDVAFWNPLEPIWTNVVTKKMYITGGCGALYDGAAPDASKNQKSITRIHQAYGRNYQLPNTTAYNETCANIGNVLWNWRMFLATGEAKFVDVMELSLYNSVLSGVALDGTNFFYTNPLRVTDPLPTPLRWSRTRVPFVTSFCCPPNVVRTIAESGSYAYTKTADAIWVNLYGANRFQTKMENGNVVKLEQETEYPWNGRVRIKVVESGAKEFTLKLRIPGWAKTCSLRINNGLPDESGTPGSYLEIKRTWKSGDFVDLDLPMPVRLMEANPLVEEDRNQVAVQRGPMVYCLEGADLPKGVSVPDVVVPADIQLMARYDGRLLGGVVVLEGKAMSVSKERWNGQLYRDQQAPVVTPVNLRLIPYCLWDNRGAGEMTVWLPKGNF